MSDLPVAGRSEDWLARPMAARLTNLPSRLPVVFFWTTLTVSLAVLLGVFTPWLVLPVLAVVLALTWRLGPDRVAVDRESTFGAITALGLVAVWVLINVWFASEVLLVQRDAGFLGLTGYWLSGHADPDIPLRTAADVADTLPFASAVSDAFARDGAVMQAQGAKTFPALLAMGGWVGGLRGVLVTNLLIGGLALLALYDIGRRLLSAWWALLPMVALMLSMPFLYFSRTPFTEPTNIVLTLGGLAVLWSAPGQRHMWRYALGGGMVGANALSRIDGAAVVVGLVGALAVVAAATRDREVRRSRAVGFLVATGAAAAMVLLGYLDLRTNSPRYLSNHEWLYQPLIMALLAAVVASILLLAVTWPAGVSRWVAEHARVLGWFAAATVVTAGVVLASRPLWMQRRAVKPGSGQEWFVKAIQRDAGVPIDGLRSYDEWTVRWLAWFYGGLTVALAVIGAALLVRRAIVRRRPELVVLLVTLAVPSLLYLVRPSITPDQIWAMRRFLPAAIPAMLLCAAWLLRAVLAVARPAWLRGLAWVGVVVMGGYPLITWGSLVHTDEFGGRMAEVTALCDLVQSGQVVVLRGSDPPLASTLRILCDADALEVRREVSQDELALLKETWGGGEVFVVSYSDRIPGWPQDLEPTIRTPMARWPNSLFPQRGPIRFTSELRVATIEDDGSVTPISAVAAP